jgi:hypothetical protein
MVCCSRKVTAAAGRFIGAIAMLALPSSASFGQAPVPPTPGAPTGELRWLAGCWERRSGTLLIEEQWTVPRAGVLLGVSRTTRGDSLIGFEFMRIHSRGDTLIFAAQPSGQAAAEFSGRSPAAGSVVFENAAHDFPQRIHYRATGADSLHARIEGMQQGQLRGVNFPYARASCGPQPPRR